MVNSLFHYSDWNFILINWLKWTLFFKDATEYMTSKVKKKKNYIEHISDTDG